MAKGKLNQVIAVVTGKKSRAQALLTESHHGWNKEAVAGILKTYDPKDAEGDQLPPEQKQIHLDVPTKVREATAEVAAFLDVVATQEMGNTQAKANIDVDGNAFLKDIPVTTLLFLEKQLVDLRTFVQGLPVLPPDREWHFDDNRNCFVAGPVTSVRTQKQPKVIVKYAATPEHPAQTELFSEDVIVGTWQTTYLSSAIPAKQKAEILHRIEVLQDAVKVAREVANSIDVEQQKIGEKIMNHIFGDLLRGAR